MPDQHVKHPPIEDERRPIATDGAERPRDVSAETEEPPDPDEDLVGYASWESFPASDAPGWR